jgi:GAF domain-containing protein
VVRYVARTREWVHLGASGDQRFSRDPHFLKRRPKSFLCAPVAAGGRVLGVLYLENDLAAQAFTPDRVQVLEILASQAAISLENARFFEESKTLNASLEQQILERQRAEEALRVSEERFRELVQRAPEAILVHDLELGRFTDANPLAVRLFGRSLEELMKLGPQDLYASAP